MPAAVALGGRLFAARGWVPVPLVAVALLLARGPGSLLVPGLLVLVVGAALRLWGVAWIGPRSRTRGDDVGALVTGGPYAWSRNPLYAANLVMWAGIGLLTGRVWLAPVLVVPLAAHYALVVRWEEANLAEKLGDVYTAWCGRTARWIGAAAATGQGSADWAAAARSERSTWLAVVAVATAVLLLGSLRST